MKKPKYRFGVLTGTKCGVREMAEIAALYTEFFARDPKLLPAAGTDIKIACRSNHVFVARECVTGEPIVGALVFFILKSFDGPTGLIEFPTVLPGYEPITFPLINRAVEFAKKKGLRRVDAFHRVRGVKWQYRKALMGSGFMSMGVHYYSLDLTVIPPE